MNWIFSQISQQYLQLKINLNKIYSSGWMSQLTSGIFNFQIQPNSTIRWFCSDCHIDRQFVFFKNMERSDGKYVINSIEEEISGEFKMSNTQCEDSKVPFTRYLFWFCRSGYESWSWSKKKQFFLYYLVLIYFKSRELWPRTNILLSKTPKIISLPSCWEDARASISQNIGAHEFVYGFCW